MGSDLAIRAASKSAAGLDLQAHRWHCCWARRARFSGAATAAAAAQARCALHPKPWSCAQLPGPPGRDAAEFAYRFLAAAMQHSFRPLSCRNLDTPCHVQITKTTHPSFCHSGLTGKSADGRDSAQRLAGWTDGRAALHFPGTLRPCRAAGLGKGHCFATQAARNPAPLPSRASSPRTQTCARAHKAGNCCLLRPLRRSCLRDAR